MPLLSFKIIVTPVLIATVTYISRRWGAAVGGWFVALPLTSGPVSVFLALEQGREFAVAAARGSLLGCIAATVFCVVYGRVSKFFAWPAAVCISFVCYVPVVFAVSVLPPSFMLAVGLILGVLCLAVLDIGHPAAEVSFFVPPWWDMPLRMIVATGIVLLITSAAASFGPGWSGLLSTFPAFVCVLTVFAHIRSGATGAGHMLRGVIVGSFSFVAFYCAVALLLPRFSLVQVYGAACATAMGVHALMLHLLMRTEQTG